MFKFRQQLSGFLAIFSKLFGIPVSNFLALRAQSNRGSQPQLGELGYNHWAGAHPSLYCPWVIFGASRSALLLPQYQHLSDGSALANIRRKALLTSVGFREHMTSCLPRGIECFHSRGQHLCKFIGRKESVYIRKKLNSHRTGLGHQHGRRFIVLGHQYGRRDVM